MDIEKTFTYHPPKGDQAERYIRIRDGAKAFAQIIADNSPASPEQTIALRDVQRATQMANAAIAINEA